jgi:hypothetical protein
VAAGLRRFLAISMIVMVHAVGGIMWGGATHMFTSAYLASQDLEVEGLDMVVDAPNGVKYVKVQPGKSAAIKFTDAKGHVRLLMRREVGRALPS